MSLPKLIELKIDKLEETQLALILTKLPKLVKINDLVIKKKNKKILNGKNDENETQQKIPTNRKNEHTEILFSCVNFLFREQNTDFNITNNFDNNLKQELKSLSLLINTDSSLEIIESFNLKAESEINWFVLKYIIKYLESYGDVRVAKIIHSIVERNKMINDRLFEFVEITQNLKNQVKKFQIRERKNFNEKKKMQEKLQELKKQLDNVNANGQVMERPKTTANLPKQRLFQNEYHSNPKNIKNTFIALNTSTEDTNNTFAPKVLIKNNILDVISEAFSSKKRFDQMTLETFLPFKNLKEHLEESLYNKFGLKKIVVNILDSIYMTLNEFGEKDIEIFIFKKILQFELSEEFYDTYLQMIKTLQSCYYYLLNSQNPNTSKERLLDIFNKNLENHIDLKDAYTVLVLLYNQNFANELWKDIQSQLIQEEEASPKRLRTTESEKIKKLLLYKEFEDFIIKTITNNQVLYLKKLTQIFRGFDKNSDGKLTENEFVQMIKRISMLINTELHVEELLKRLDPTNTKVISYSPCVALISTLFANLNNEELCIISILNKKVL